MVFNDENYAGELWHDQLVSMCEADGTEPSTGGGSVDVSAACPVLKKFDLHDNLDSKGAVLFRRFVDHVRSATPVSTPISAQAASTSRSPQAGRDATNPFHCASFKQRRSTGRLAGADRFWYKLRLAAAQPGSAVSRSLPASDERRSPGRCLRGQLLDRRR